MNAVTCSPRDLRGPWGWPVPWCSAVCVTVFSHWWTIVDNTRPDRAGRCHGALRSGCPAPARLSPGAERTQPGVSLAGPSRRGPGSGFEVSPADTSWEPPGEAEKKRRECSGPELPARPKGSDGPRPKPTGGAQMARGWVFSRPRALSTLPPGCVPRAPPQPGAAAWPDSHRPPGASPAQPADPPLLSAQSEARDAPGWQPLSRQGSRSPLSRSFRLKPESPPEHPLIQTRPQLLRSVWAAARSHGCSASDGERLQGVAPHRPTEF